MADNLPPELSETGSEAKLLRWLNMLLRALKSREIRSSPTVRVRRTSQGTFLETTAPPGQGGSNPPVWL